MKMWQLGLVIMLAFLVGWMARTRYDMERMARLWLESRTATQMVVCARFKQPVCTAPLGSVLAANPIIWLEEPK